MNSVELLGYVAMFTVAGSFLLKDVLKLRLVNSVGAILFVIYGALLGSIPIVGLNLFVAFVNGYYIVKQKSDKTADKQS